MSKGLMKHYRDYTLAKKIRLSFIALELPLVVMLLYCIYCLWDVNSRYDDMIQSAVVASEFSLDFKRDFDDEAYLLIAGNKTIEESEMSNLLSEAGRVENDLYKLTTSESNLKRLKSARKYLQNLDTYKSRIEENIKEGDLYEENMLIWENDIQIVSALLQETMSEYIYYEIKDLQIAKDQYQIFYEKLIHAIFAAMGIILVLLLILMLVIPRSISKPIAQLSSVTRQVAKGDLTARSNVEVGGEVGELSYNFNVMIDKINELLAQVTNEQIRLRKAELELLQSQINPHFLYNTLDTIVWLAEGSDQKAVVSMVQSLSEFFKTSLNQGKEIVTIAEEIKHARSYLEIQHVRYQDILEYEINIPESLYQCWIPKITIQPLIENALYHGIKNQRGMGKITVTGAEVDGHCEIYVKDNGKGMTPERLKQVHEKITDNRQVGGEIFGLSNVNERIQLKFGKEYGIVVDSVLDQGTEIVVKLPMPFDEDE